MDQLGDSLRSYRETKLFFFPLPFLFLERVRSIKYKGEFHCIGSRENIRDRRSRFRCLTDLRFFFFFEQLLSTFYHSRFSHGCSNTDESNPNHLTSHHLETIRINLQYADEISNTRRCSRNTDLRYSVLIRGFRKFRRLATEPPPLVRPSPVSTRWKLSTSKGHHPRCIISFRSRYFQLSDSRFHLSVPIATEM